MNRYLFPEQTILCDNETFSRELLRGLLEKVFAVTDPITGYLRIDGDEAALLFLFFFNGAPYAAGRYSGGKPFSISIQEFGKHLEASSSENMLVTLCKTDPVLLKCMLLFLQEEPAVKAPTSFIDLEFIVRQIAEGNDNAMVTLCRDNKFNFFFFRDGNGALAHYADREFERPEGMTVDEEMLLYAFQPGAEVEAYIFRKMVTTEAGDADKFDRESLIALLAGGKPKEMAAQMALQPEIERVEPPLQKPGLPCVELTVESGPLQGERFTVTLPCTIGRNDCDLILNDTSISRRHAELKIVERKLVIEDLGSTNGTKVNGEMVTTKRLVPYDLISIGKTNLRITPA